MENLIPPLGYRSRYPAQACEMKIQKPIWNLNATCPVCEQGGSLVLLTCPNCATVIAACDEDGSVFPNLTDLQQTTSVTCDPRISTTTRCPTCDALNEFRHATSNEIADSGLTPEQYS